MKKNIDLVIDGIAPEKVMYDTDNHSLVVLYPAQEEFKVGDRVVLKSHSMKNLSVYNGFIYFSDMNTSNGSYIVIEEVKIYEYIEKQTTIYGTNSVTGKRYFYPIEWLEHHNAEFKKGDILTAVGACWNKTDITFVYDEYVISDKGIGYFKLLCGGVFCCPISKAKRLRNREIKYGFNKNNVRYASDKEIEKFDNDLKEIGKKWNRETLEVEDIVDEFKKGDIVIHDNTSRVAIFDEYVNSTNKKVFKDITSMMNISNGKYVDVTFNRRWNADTLRMATDNEAKLLFDLLKKIGKKWNRDTLEVEDLDISEIAVDLKTACEYLEIKRPSFFILDACKRSNKFEAQMELQLICEAWNKFDEFVVDLAYSGQCRYYPIINLSTGNIEVGGSCVSATVHSACYSFKSKERALQFGNQFKELFKIAMGL